MVSLSGCLYISSGFSVAVWYSFKQAFLCYLFIFSLPFKGEGTQSWENARRDLISSVF